MVQKVTEVGILGLILQVCWRKPSLSHDTAVLVYHCSLYSIILWTSLQVHEILLGIVVELVKVSFPMAKHHTVKAYREVGLKLWAMVPWGPLGFFSGSSGLIEMLHAVTAIVASLPLFCYYFVIERKFMYCVYCLYNCFCSIQFRVYYVGYSVYLAHITGHYTNCFL